MNAQTTIKRPLIVKFLAVLLSVLTFFSGLSGLSTVSTSVQAAGTPRNWHKVRMYDTDGWWLNTVNLSYGGYTVAEGGGVGISKMRIVDGTKEKIAYCIAPGMPLRAGWTVADDDDGSVTNYLDKVAPLNTGKRRALSLAMYYGYGGADDKTNTTDYNMANFATQVLIWELVTDKRQTVSPYARLKDDIYGHIRFPQQNKTSFDTITKRITDAMVAHSKKATFGYDYIKDATNAAITLKSTDGGKTYVGYTAADSNKILGSYKWTSDNANVTIKVTSDNKLKIVSTKAVTGNILITGKRTIQKGSNLASTQDVIWGNWNGYNNPNVDKNKHVQVLSEGLTVDPMTTYVSAKTDSLGSIQINKEFKDYEDKKTTVSEDIAQSLHFYLKTSGGKYIALTKNSNGKYTYKATSKYTSINSILKDYSNGGSYCMTLDPKKTYNGLYRITIDGLQVGDYTVVEYEDDAYYQSGYAVVEANNQTVSVTPNGTAAVTFQNRPTAVILRKYFSQEQTATVNDYKGLYLNILNSSNKTLTFAYEKVITDKTTNRSTKVYRYDPDGSVKNLDFIATVNSKETACDIELVAMPRGAYTVNEGGAKKDYFTFRGLGFELTNDTTNKPNSSYYDNATIVAPVRKSQTNVRKSDGEFTITKTFLQGGGSTAALRGIELTTADGTVKSLSVSELRGLMSFSVSKQKPNSTGYEVIKFFQTGQSTYTYNPNGNISALKFNNGTEKIFVKGLPYTNYRVTENNMSYTVSDAESISLMPGLFKAEARTISATITQGSSETFNFAFKNTYTPKAGITVKKNFVDPSGDEVPVPATSVTKEKVLYFTVRTFEGNFNSSKYISATREQEDGVYTYKEITTKEKATHFVLTHGENNEYTFDLNGLPNGTYVIQEVMAGSVAHRFEYGNQYKSDNSDDSCIFSVSNKTAKESFVLVEMKNVEKVGSLIIKKESEDDNKVRTFRVRGFTNYDYAGHAISNSSRTFDELDYIVTTDENGIARLDNLPLYCPEEGYTSSKVQYQVEEIDDLNCYILPEPQHIFLCDDSGELLDESLRTVTMTNVLERGALTINKTLEDPNDPDPKPIQGICFSVQDDQGKYYDADGKSSDTMVPLVTDANGQIVIKNLVAARAIYNSETKVYDETPIPYTVTELSNDKLDESLRNPLIDKLVLSEPQIVTFDLSKKQLGQELAEELNVKNRFKTGSLKLIKTNAKTGGRLIDAEFKVYPINEDGTEGEGITLTQSTASDGQLTGLYYIDNLVVGTYRLKETKYPAGMRHIDDENATFTIVKDGGSWTAYTDENNKVQFIGTFVIESKANEDATKLTKQKFDIADEDFDFDQISDEAAEYWFEVYESKMIEYTSFYQYKNVPIELEISLIKKDSKTRETLTGASFALYVDSNNNGQFDDQDHLVESNNGFLKDLGNGNYAIDNVPLSIVSSNTSSTTYNKYFVKEISAPEGYSPSKEVYTIEITSDKIKVNDVYAPSKEFENAKISLGDIYNDRIYGSVHILKYDATTEELLSGAEFTLYVDKNKNHKYDSGDTVYDNTNDITHNNLPSDATPIVNGIIPEEADHPGHYRATGLPYGNYVVRETKTPSSIYAENNKDYPFSIVLPDDSVDLADLKKDIDGNSEDDVTGIIIGDEFNAGIPNTPVLAIAQVVKYDVRDYSYLADRTFNVYRTSNSEPVDTVQAVGNTITLTGIKKGGYWLKLADPQNKSETNMICHVGSQLEENTGKDIVIDLEHAHAPVPAVTFTLTNTETGATKEGTSTSKGFATFGDISKGSYTIAETKVPAGFKGSNQVFSFTVTDSDNSHVFRYTMENDTVPSSVVIEKTSEDGVIENVLFSIVGTTDYNEKVDIQRRTNAQGIISEELDPGKYTITELSVAGRYVEPKSQTITLRRSNTAANPYKVQFSNVLRRGNIELYKFDAEYPETKLSNAKFTIYNDVNGNGKYDKSTDTVFGTANKGLTEDTAGHYQYVAKDEETIAESGIPYGKYLLKETKAPDGFKLDKNYYPFSIDASNTNTTQNIENDPGKGFGNQPIKTNIKIYKVDEADKTTYLKGAKFDIYKDTDNNGKLSTTKDKKLGQLTETTETTTVGGVTVTNPIYTYDNLRSGKYFIVETKAPDGYVLDNTPHLVDLKLTDEQVSAEDFVITITNGELHGSVVINKFDAETLDALSGAVFTIYNDNGQEGVFEEGTDTEYAVIPETETKGVYELGSIPKGKYIVKETATPPGFEENTDTYSFKIKTDGYVATLVDTRTRVTKLAEKFTALNPDDIKGIYNAPIRNDVAVYKYVTKDLSKFNGKTFELYSENGALVSTAVAADNTVDFHQQEAGRYTVKVHADPKVYAVINLSKKGVAKIANLASVYVPVSGAEFTLYNSANKKIVPSQNPDDPGYIYRFTTNPMVSGADGYVTFKGLPKGSYKIRETKAPTNYDANTKTISVTVDNSTSTYSYSLKNTETIRYYKIIKTSDDGVVADIEFEVLGTTNNGEQKNFTVKTDENGVIAEQIELGTYTVTEKNVNGCYRSVAPQTIKVTAANTEDNPATVTFENIHKRGNVEVVKSERDNLIGSTEEYIAGDPSIGIIPDNPVTPGSSSVTPSGSSTSGETPEFKDATFVITGKDINGKKVSYTLKYVGNNTYRYLESTDPAVVKEQGLLYGKYTLKETKAPKGYVRDTNTYTFRISEDGVTVNVNNSVSGTFENTPITVDVKLTKLNRQNEKLKGAVFALYKDNKPFGNTIGTEDEYITDMTDNGDGTYTAPQLRYGKYAIQETKAPEGYDVNDTPVFFDVSGYDSVTEQEVQNGLTKELEPFLEDNIKAPITVKKINEETKEALSGATFTLYIDKNKNGKLNLPEDTKVCDLTETAEKGVYTSGDVDYGNYLVIETQQPEGFEENNTVYPAKVEENNTPVVIVDVDSDGNPRDGVYNTPIRNGIEVFKYDVRDISYLKGQTMKLYDTAGTLINTATSDSTTVDFGTANVGRYYVRLASNDKIIASVRVKTKGPAVLNLTQAIKPLKGAEFTLYQADGTTKVNDPEHTQNPVTTGDDGYAVFTNLPYGEYVIKETKAPANHDKSTKTINAEVTSSTATYSYAVNNVETERYYKIVKTADDGNIADVKFSIVGETAEGIPVNIPEVKTDINGTILKKIKLGTYTITELEQKNCYRPLQSQTITVTAANTSNNPATVTFNNVHKRGNVKVVKFDPEYPDTEMKDAEFTIYGTNLDGESVSYKLTYVGNNTYKYLADDSKIAEKGLIYGNYTLKETKAPTGFIKDEGTYSFAIKEDLKTVEVQNQAGKGFANDAIKVDIKLVKVEKNTTKQLSGATFALYKDNEPYGKEGSNDTKLTDLKDNKNGTYTAQSLRYGRYYVKETNAPKGYNKDSTSQFFEIKGYDGATLDQVQNHLIVKDLDPMTDTPVTGSVLIRKFNAETQELLTGAVFTMYEDTNGNSAYDKDTDKVYTGSENGQIPESETKGIYTLNGIHYGTYFIVETQQPKGFEKNNNVYTVKIQSQSTQAVITDQQVIGASADLQGVYNTPIRNDVEVFKYDIRDLSYLKGQTLVLKNADNTVVAETTSQTTDYDFGTFDTGRYTVVVKGKYKTIAVIDLKKQDQAKITLNAVRVPLAGAEFTIYDKVTNEPVNDAKVQNPVITGEDGYAKFTQLSYGEYIIKETKAPANHDLSTEVINVSVQDSTSTYSYSMNNIETIRYYKIVKTSDDGDVQNVKFSLKGTTANGEPREIKELITDKDGVILNSIELGTYTITEIDVKDCYRTPKSQTVTVTKNNTENNPATVQFSNIHKRGNVQVLKFDSEYPDTVMDDAEFTIYGKDLNGQDVSYKLTYVGNNTYKYLTDDSKIAEEGLIYGDYTLKETKAPTGFIKDTGTYNFSITEDKKTVNVENQAGKGFANDAIKVDVSLTKTAACLEGNAFKGPAHGKPLPGATFALYKDNEPYGKAGKNDTKLGNMTDNGDGTYAFEALRYGHYYVQETKAPEGYNVNDKIQFFNIEGYDGATLKDVQNHLLRQDLDPITDTKITGSVIVRKFNAETQELLTGAVFTLYNDNGKIGTFEEGIDTEYDIIPESGTKGVYTLDNLDYGKYLVVETKQPKGFEKNNKVYSIAIETQNQQAVVTDAQAIGSSADKQGVYNTPIRNDVEVFKYDVRDLSYLKGKTLVLMNGENTAATATSDTTSYSFGQVAKGRYTVKVSDTGNIIAVINLDTTSEATLDLTSVTVPLEGAEFTIYNKDGSVVNDAEHTQNPVTTGKDGYAKFTQLLYGEYVIKETKAPANHDITNQEIEVVISDSTSIYSYSINNDRTERYYKIVKKSDDGKIKDIKFSVVGTTANGVPVNIPEVKTDKNGVILNKIELGTYTITELETADCYRKTSAQTIEVTSANTGDNPATVTFNNLHKRGNVQVVKFDPEYPDTVMDDAEFTVYGKDLYGEDVSYTLTYVGNNTYKYVTDDSKIKTEGLIYGDYTLKETKAPYGFIQDTQTYNFTIKEDNKTVTVENEAGKGFANHRINVNISLIKAEENNTATHLPNATFEIYKDNGTHNKVDEADKLLGTLTDNKDGSYTFKKLPYGHYYIKETKAPEGYNVNNNIQFFEVKGYDNVTLEEVENGIVMSVDMIEDAPITGSVEIKKINKETKELLSGATFVLYADSNGSGKYESTDAKYDVIPEISKGIYRISGIRYGTYFVKETKSPEGFEENKTVYKVQIKTQDTVEQVVDVDKNGNKLDGVYNTPIRNDVEIFKYDVRDLSYLKGRALTLKNGSTVVAETTSSTISYNFGKVDAGRYLVTLGDKIIAVINMSEQSEATLDLKSVSVPLQGAEFTIYEADGKTKVNDPEHTINPIVTGEDGYAVFTKLLYGEYVIRETKAPANHNILTDAIPVVINDSVSTYSYSVNNTATKAPYKIIKTADDGKVANIRFAIEGTTANGEPVSMTVRTNSKGEFVDSIELGTYTITELDVNACYKEIKSQTITVTAANTENNPATAKFDNLHKRGNVEVLKIDPKYPDTEMKDAEFTVYGKDLDGKDVSYKLTYVGNNTYKYITDDSKIKTEGLIYGDYTLEETKAPYGFVRDTNVYNFSITTDGTTERVYNEPGKSFINNRIEVDISLTKRETLIEGNTVKGPVKGKLLSGATFELYQDNGTVKTVDKADKLLGTLTDNKDGTYSYADLCYGNYYVVETKAPEGYNLNKEPIFFSVDGYDNVTLEEVENTIVQDIGYIEDKPITAPIEIRKLNAETQELLSGATFTLYKDSNGNGKLDDGDTKMMDFTEVDTGIYVAEDIRYGKYLIKETKVPEGFEQNSKVYTAVIETQDKVVKVSDAQKSGIENTPIRNNVEIFKHDVRDLSYLKGKTLTLKNGSTEIPTTSDTTVYNFGTVEAGRYIVNDGSKIIAVINVNEKSEAVLDLKSVSVPLQGAEFTIYNKDGSVVEDPEHTQNPVVTDETGYAMFTQLLYGEYEIRETKAPANHDILEDSIPVIINDSTSTHSYSVNNTATKAFYKIVKISDDGKIENIKFSLTGTTATGEPVNFPVLKTDNNGTIINKIELGTYTITELDVADCYRPVESQIVTVTAENTEDNPATVQFTNIHKRGNVELLKKDPKYPATEMKDAEFTIYGKDLNGKDVSYKLTYVGNNTYKYLADNSKIAAEGLIYGDYTLKETKAPYGFVQDTKTYNFSITKDGVTERVYNEPGKSFINNRIEVDISLAKREERPEGNTSNSSEKLLPGATFELYRYVPKMLQNGTEAAHTNFDDDILLGQLTDNGDGTYSYADLCYGRYYIKETKAPEGYNLNDKLVFFNVENYDDVTLEEVENTIVQDVGYVDDKPITAPIEIRKVNAETQELLSGAVFTLYKDSNGNNAFDEADVEIRTFTETEKGVYVAEDVRYGTYFIKETKVPEGFEQNSKVYTAVIKSQDKVVKVSDARKDNIENTPIRNNAEIFKYDIRNMSHLKGQTLELRNAEGTAVASAESDTVDYSFGQVEAGRYTVAADNKIIAVINMAKAGNAALNLSSVQVPLKGAEFTIYNKTTGEAVNDPEHTQNPVVTGEDGYAVFTDLLYGEYIIRETKAPANHDKSNEEINVNIKNSTSVYSFSMNNTETKRYYKIVKTSDDGVIENVRFSVTGTTKNGMPVNIPEVKTDANGEFLSKIELGTYTITELDIPDRYRPAASQTIEVTSANKSDNPATVTFENIHKRGNVEVIKFNPDFPDVEIPDAIFTVKGKDLDGKDVSYELTYVGNNTYRYVENDEDIETKGLIYGDYTLEETKEPEGFLRDTGVYNFSITEDKVTVPVETDIGEGFKNDYIKGSLRIVKLDPVNHEPLSGAKFVVYSKKDNKPVTDILTTDEEGIILVEGLIYGEYYIKEIEAPQDYKLLEDTIDFEIIEHDFEIQRVIDNSPNRGKLVIRKESEDGIVENMKFRIQGEPIKGYPIDLIVETDAEGNAVAEDLPVGEYTVTEIDTPERYLQPESQTALVVADSTTKLVQKITLDPVFDDDNAGEEADAILEPTDNNGHSEDAEAEANTEFKAETTTNEPIPVNFNNILKKGKVIVLKVDEEYPDHKLAGAEFTIYNDVDGNGEYDENVDTEVGQLTALTGEDEGTYIYEKLVWGKYLIKETKAPENYKIDEEYYAFEITENDQEEVISNIEGDCFINTAIKGKLKITKVDKDYPDNKLTGAEFEVYADVNGNGKYDTEDVFVCKMPENKEEIGNYYSDELRVGKYLVKETKAPKYYVIDDNYYAVEILDENTVAVTNVTAEVKDDVEITDENKFFVNKHQDIDFVITKTDVSTAEVIPNCQIAILNEDKQILMEGTTDENGEVWFKLQPGKYYYQEIVAPNGYILNEELHPFVINTDDTIVRDTLTNTKKPTPTPDTPKTGDTTTPAIVIILVIAALISAGVIVITFRRKKRNNSK